MAAFKLVIMFLIFLAVETTNVDRKRTGGTKSVRGGRSRSSGSSGGQNYENVDLSGRIVTGSSPFTINTWRSAAIMGSIYGGHAYILKYPHERKLPPICTNSKEKSREGRAYGYFICPRETEPEDYKFCCGAENREYCCNKTMAQIFFSEHRKSTGASIGIIIGIIAAVIVIIIISTYCCKKRKQVDEIIQKSPKRDQKKSQGMHLLPLGLLQPQFGKGTSRPVGGTSHPTSDINKPADSREGKGETSLVPPPPPSYNAATTSAPDELEATYESEPPQSSIPVHDEKPEIQPTGVKTKSSSTSQQGGVSFLQNGDINSIRHSGSSQNHPSNDIQNTPLLSSSIPLSCNTSDSKSTEKLNSSTTDNSCLSTTEKAHPWINETQNLIYTSNPFSGPTNNLSDGASYSTYCNNTNSPPIIDQYTPPTSYPFLPSVCKTTSSLTFSDSPVSSIPVLPVSNDPHPVPAVPFRSNSTGNPFIPPTVNPFSQLAGAINSPLYGIPHSLSAGDPFYTQVKHPFLNPGSQSHPYNNIIKISEAPSSSSVTYSRSEHTPYSTTRNAFASASSEI